MTKISNQYSLTNVLFADAVNGRVGIGTTSPGSLLTLYETTTPKIAFQNSGAIRAAIQSDSSSLILNSVTGNDIRLQTDSITKFTITSAGNIGIGTTSPSYVLTVSAATGTNVTPQINAVNTTTNGYGILRLTGASRGGIIDFYDTTTAQASIVGQGGVLSFYTNGDSSGTAKVTISSAGNVGIGIAPSAWSTITALQIKNGFLGGVNKNVYLGSNAYYDGSIYRYSSTGYANLYYQDSNSNDHVWYNSVSGTVDNAVSFIERMRITSAGNVLVGRTTLTGGNGSMEVEQKSTGDFTLVLNSANTYKPSLYLRNEGYASHALIQTNSDLAFNVGGGTERMRITSGGQILINTTDSGAAEPLRIEGKVSGSAQYGIFVGLNATYYTSYAMRFYNSYAGTVVGSITFTTSATSYNTGSDYRLKEDLKPINGLEKVSAIKVYDFKWKGEESRMDGVLAHELQEVLPYAVHGMKDEEEYQSVDYSKIVPVLISAIQEQQLQINELKALLNA